jgi:cytochrome P450
MVRGKPAGQRCIGAAKRDPELSAELERCDIGCNPHLAFGAGIHTCVGLHVARLEGRIAIARLFARASRGCASTASQ